MIKYQRFTLSNGLKVIIHEDNSTPMAVVNVIYDVGAKDESPDHTGLAHLFEHLMFGGSINIPDYDEPLQDAGGENNAFTTNDFTNYYCMLPAENIETALWLESDRMLSLAFNEKSLEVQKKVVCEEFKENYINQPYGNIWEIIRKLSYKVHPYQWMTIGKELAQIEKTTMEDVRTFFHRHYNPSNAIVVLAGNIKAEKVIPLAEKWFGSIAAGEKYFRNLPQEPEQTTMRETDFVADVPLSAIMKTWHMGGRLDKYYHATDLITDMLGGGTSSRLFNKLVKEKQLFSSIECYHLGSTDPGLVVVEGKLVRGVKMTEAEKAIDEELEIFCSKAVGEQELEKVKNKSESAIAFEDMNIMNRASSLAIYEVLGDVSLINKEPQMYHDVTKEEILVSGNKIFRKENSNVLHYYSKHDQ